MEIRQTKDLDSLVNNFDINQYKNVSSFNVTQWQKVLFKRIIFGFTFERSMDDHSQKGVDDIITLIQNNPLLASQGKAGLISGQRHIVSDLRILDLMIHKDTAEEVLTYLHNPMKEWYRIQNEDSGEPIPKPLLLSLIHI